MQTAEPQCPSNAFQLAVPVPAAACGNSVTQAGVLQGSSGQAFSPSWRLSSKAESPLQVAERHGSG